MKMSLFSNLSIKRKLLVILLTTSGSALLLAGVGVVAADQWLFQDQMRRELSAIAQMVADNSAAALAFNDVATAQQTLAALRAKPHIATACIFREDGTMLASYSGPGPSAPCPVA